MTAGHFPADIIAAACASRARWDIPASVCLAQWALESTWGTAMPAGSNNPFGIKAVGTQPSVASVTHEAEHGTLVVVTAHFRKFRDVAEAFDAHGELLATNSHYARARSVRHDAEAFAKALTGVYATDPAYGAKLVGLMRASNLHAYDEPRVSISVRPPSVSPPPSWIERLRMALTKKAA